MGAKTFPSGRTGAWLPATTAMALVVVLLPLLLVAACEGSSGDGPAGGPDGSVAADAAPGADAGGTPAGDATGVDSATPPLPDAGGPGPDAGAPPGDTGGGAPDLPTGAGAFGEPCTLGLECQSGLCWANTLSRGCTEPCASDAECAEWGAQCRRLAEGPGGTVLEGCGPPAMDGNPACDDHDDCLYPYACRTDLGGCELPECRYDADCPADRHCHPLSRRCEVDVCQNAAVECTVPGAYCIDGRCGPPRCTGRADCPAGQACLRTTGLCDEVPPCNAEGGCDWYNQVCVDGLCEPSPCGGGCDEGQTCDPATGCYRTCAGAGGCPAGQVCDPAAGRCYTDRRPYAVAGVRMGGSVKPAASVTRGTTVTLDGSGSFDPDGRALDYRWRLDDAPPGATLTVGAPLPGAIGPTPTWQPPAAGRWAIGLAVVDAAGSASYPVVVILTVQ
jgi:hypothetical protein